MLINIKWMSVTVIPWVDLRDMKTFVKMQVYKLFVARDLQRGTWIFFQIQNLVLFF